MSHLSRITAAIGAAAVVHSAPLWVSHAAGADAAKGKPAQVVAIAGSNLSRIVLTEKAAKRIDVQTAQIRQSPSGTSIAPYAAVLYDLAGAAWVYTNPAPLTYVRHGVVVELIDGDSAYLKEGPPVGTLVVTVGVSELYGTEKGVGH